MTFYYLIFLGAFLFYTGVEYLLLNRSLGRIPLRILVNGTRGKSTLVKIIYGMLRQSGQKVFAKSSGEQPVELLPDGRVRIIPRHAPASIIENVRILRRWSWQSPDAAIIECMALQPETQGILARFIFKPHYTLITNILPDHAEAAGSSLKEMSETMLECIDENARVLLPENLAGSLRLKNKAAKEVLAAAAEPYPESFEHIPPQVIHQSWCLTKALAGRLGITTDIASRAFRDTWESVNRGIRLSSPELNFTFWNLFSVNDVESAAAIIRHSGECRQRGRQTIVVFNTRSDRPLRTRDFINLIQQEFPEAAIWLTGTGRYLARRLLLKSALNSRPVRLATPGELYQILEGGFKTPAIIYGIGNYSGMGNIVGKIQGKSILNQ
jgi:poly-gamma-glutamate synthase PgsB/CapB